MIASVEADKLVKWIEAGGKEPPMTPEFDMPFCRPIPRLDSEPSAARFFQHQCVSFLAPQWLGESAPRVAIFVVLGIAS